MGLSAFHPSGSDLILDVRREESWALDFMLAAVDADLVPVADLEERVFLVVVVFVFCFYDLGAKNSSSSSLLVFFPAAAAFFISDISSSE